MTQPFDRRLRRFWQVLFQSDVALLTAEAGQVPILQDWLIRFILDSLDGGFLKWG